MKTLAILGVWLAGLALCLAPPAYGPFPTGTGGGLSSNEVYSIALSVGGPTNWIEGESWNINWKNVVFVSAALGTNATGARENPSRPFLTVRAATDAASYGDTVVVMPGTYYETVTNREGVGYYLNSGVIITNDITAAPAGVFYVPDNVTNLVIRGSGAIVNPSANAIIAYSSNVVALVADLHEVGRVAGSYKSVEIRANVVNKGPNKFLPGAGAATFYYSALDKSARPGLTYTESSYPAEMVFNDYSVTNIGGTVISDNITIRAGAFTDGGDGHTGTLTFRDTEIISWYYEDDPGFYGATIKGSYFYP